MAEEVAQAGIDVAQGANEDNLTDVDGTDKNEPVATDGDEMATGGNGTSINEEITNPNVEGSSNNDGSASGDKSASGGGDGSAEGDKGDSSDRVVDSNGASGEGAGENVGSESGGGAPISSAVVSSDGGDGGDGAAVSSAIVGSVAVSSAGGDGVPVSSDGGGGNTVEEMKEMDDQQEKMEVGEDVTKEDSKDKPEANDDGQAEPIGDAASTPEEHAQKEEKSTDKYAPEIVDASNADNDQAPLEERLDEEDRGGSAQSDRVIMIDGVPVLENISEENEEGDDEEEEQTREELILEIKDATEQRDRLLFLTKQIQQEVAEYLARRKDDEKADPGRTTVDHEKKYFQCMTTLEGLQEDLDAAKEKCEKQKNEEELLKNQKLDEVREASAKFAKYRKDKVVKAMNNRTGKRIAETDVDYFLITEAMKEADIVQVRLESIKLQHKISKLEAEIKQKEQLSGGLHMIDFEQLKINNVDLNEKIEERNDDIVRQKRKVTSTVQVLTHVKEKLQFLQAENAEKKETLRELDGELATRRDHLTRMKQARDSLRSDNIHLKQKGGLVGHTTLLRDYEDKQDQSKEMQEKLEMLQKRHSELAVMCDGLKRKIEQAKLVDADIQ